MAPKHLYTDLIHQLVTGDLTMAAMSKQHFQLIADVLRDYRETYAISDEDARELAKTFASTLQATNTKFNRERFLTAALR